MFSSSLFSRMAERINTYFVSDVHLGLQAFDPRGREERFVSFLRSIDNDRTDALYMLGDIWDFWYEWKSTVPKGYVDVFAAIRSLLSHGIKVYFCTGNHDIWAYSYFEELGMTRLPQPALVKVAGKTLCVGHGDGLGVRDPGYKVLRTVFHSRIAQLLFSSLIHPTLAMALGNAWSRHNRLARGEKYVWKGKAEPLVAWCENFLQQRKVDGFVFGHYHVSVNEALNDGTPLVILDSWIERDSVFCISQEALS